MIHHCTGFCFPNLHFYQKLFLSCCAPGNTFNSSYTNAYFFSTKQILLNFDNFVKRPEARHAKLDRSTTRHTPHFVAKSHSKEYRGGSETRITVTNLKFVS
jgi:hypothetical protein